MNKITLSCEIITPMFAGSAIPGRCELRPPAIKGALRFWWRALNAYKDVERLRKEEAALFGSSDEAIGRSKIQIEVRHKLNGTLPDFKGKGQTFAASSRGRTFTLNVLDYLAYGCHEYVTGQGLKYTRPAFMPGGEFDLTILWDNEETARALFQALDALLRFGGLGARTRNGWGKFTVKDLPTQLHVNIDHANQFSQGLPAFTGLSKASTVFSSKSTFPNWDKALAHVGLIYHHSRQALERKHYYDRRVMVAQPIIVEKENVKEMFLERHSKSMFLSVVKEGGQYRGQILFMPYQFLEKIEDSTLSQIPTKIKVPRHFKTYQAVHKDLREMFESKMNYRNL